MSKGFLATAAIAVFVFALPLVADAKIEITGAALVSAQKVDFDSTSGNLDEDFNFNDPRVNLYINGDITDKISIGIGLWAGNDYSHENTRLVNDGQVAARGNNIDGLTASAVNMLNACIIIKDVMGTGMNLKPGLIDIPYGFEWTRRTNHGDDKNNDFITNGLLDINGTENGISLSGGLEGHFKTPATWEIALMNGGSVTDGNPSGAGEAVRSNRDLAWAARFEGQVQDNLTIQASYYKNNERKDGDQDPLNVGSAFLVNNINAMGTGAAGTAANPNLNGLVFTNGYDRSMWEASAKYDYGQGYVLGFWGDIKADSSTTGAVSLNRKWKYWGAQGRYNFDENSYAAVRYNKLDPDYSASNNLGEPHLWTVAAGYKLADNAMVKAEWSKLDEGGDGFGNAAAANTNDGRSSDADALTVAVGVSF